MWGFEEDVAGGEPPEQCLGQWIEGRLRPLSDAAPIHRLGRIGGMPE